MVCGLSIHTRLYTRNYKNVVYIMKELQLLAVELACFDDDPDKTMFFYNHPEKRSELFDHFLTTQIYNVASMRGYTDKPHVLKERTRVAVAKLCDRFWSVAWPTHSVHFHKDFQAWLRCPFTCLTEVADVLRKIGDSDNS